MPKKVSNIHKRKDGRWEGRYKTGAYENGATKYRSIYGKSYGEVRDRLRDIQRNPEADLLPRGREKTFREVLKLWSEGNRVCMKESTAYKYDYLIETHILPDLGDLKISLITASRVNAFLDRKLKSGRIDKKGGLSPAYVKTMMLIIQSALRFAADAGYCSPIKGKINKPVEAKEELAILDESEQKRLEMFLINDRNVTSVGVMISLHTGLRIGEVCALSWNDVDFANQIIHVRHTVARIGGDKTENGAGSRLIIDTPKTKASKRDIPISSLLLPLLLESKQQAASEFVVSDRKGFLSPRTYEYRYHRLLNACGIADINYHALRHTFATRCVEAGVDVKSLSEMLGHANVAVTLNTYVHSSMDLKRTQLEKLVRYSA